MALLKPTTARSLFGQEAKKCPWQQSGLRAITHVACWTHARRELFKVYETAKSAIAEEALRWISELTITPTACGLLLDAQKGFAFVVDCSRAKEFALAH